MAKPALELFRDDVMTLEEAIIAERLIDAFRPESDTGWKAFDVLSYLRLRAIDGQALYDELCTLQLDDAIDLLFDVMGRARWFGGQKPRTDDLPDAFRRAFEGDQPA